jgi:glycopeptide antibiotics resistance protein
MATTTGRRRLKPRVTLWLVAIVYAVLLLAVTLVPVQWGAELARQSASAAGAASDRLPTLVSHAANVLLFVPFGLLLPEVVPRQGRPGLVMMWGAASSILIELAQTTMPFVRFADVRDVILNTLGAGVGLLGLELIRRVSTRRRAGYARPGPPPT